MWREIERRKEKRERDRWGERASDREMERERWEINEGKMSPSVHSSFNNLFAISFSKEEKEVKKITTGVSPLFGALTKK